MSQKIDGNLQVPQALRSVTTPANKPGVSTDAAARQQYAVGAVALGQFLQLFALAHRWRAFQRTQRFQLGACGPDQGVHVVLDQGLALNVQGLGETLQRLTHRRSHPCSCWSRSSMRDAIASGLIL